MVFLISIFFFILIKRIFFFIRIKNSEAEKKIISQLVAICLEKNTTFFLDKKLPYEHIIQVIEDYNHRLIGEDWVVLKQSIIDNYLLQYARKKTNSMFWLQRNLAARVFLLYQKKSEESSILNLMQDSSFLVSCIASKAAIAIESIQGLDILLDKMSKSVGYSYYFYLDVLSKASVDLLKKMSLLAQEKSIYQKIILDVFALQTVPISLPFLQECLISSDKELQYKAIQVLIKNPQADKQNLLIDILNNKEKEFQIVAAKELQNYPTEETRQALVKKLQDSHWSVKINVATTLKNLGNSDLITDEKLKNYVTIFE